MQPETISTSSPPVTTENSFDKTGLYEVHGSYYLDFNDPDAESLRTIWEDYISADFTLKIIEANEASKKPDAYDGK